MTTVHLADSSDLDAVISLCEAHAAYERAEFNTKGLDERLKQAIEGQYPRLVIFLAEIDDKPAGYAAVTRDFSTWEAREYLHLDCLFLEEKARGRNIGRRLFSAIADYASELGIKQIQWQTPDWNTGAIRFYRALGASSEIKVRFTFNLHE